MKDPFCRHHDCDKPGLFRTYKAHMGFIHSVPHCEDHSDWAELVLEDHVDNIKEGEACQE